MNISKISRSIVVAIFVVFLLFLSYLNITQMISAGGTSDVSSNLIKLSYGVILIALVLIYVYIKDKLYKLNVRRKIAFIYRYIYISVVVIGTSLITIYNMFDKLSIKMLVIYVVMSFAVSVIVKKVIFNVSKSDILSLFAMFAFSMFPNVIADKSIYFVSMAVMLVMFGIILLIQVTLDELKQCDLKSKKYLILSVVIGVLVALSMILGINSIVWITLGIVLFFITTNLDKTHISFSRKFMSKVDSNKREGLYKLERININKIIITVVIVAIVAIATYYASTAVINTIGDKFNTNQEYTNIVDNFKKSSSSIEFNIGEQASNFVDYGTNFVVFAKTYYMIIFIYILFMELLAVILHRKYDTKSTILKLLFVLIFAIVTIFKLNIMYFQPLLSIMLILIAVVNTSSIYLNREERIKMLVA